MTRPVKASVDPVWTRVDPIVFWVEGEPQSKGSIRAFVKPGMKYPVLTSTNKHLKEWEKTVAFESKRVMSGQLFHAPVDVDLLFWMPRPQRLKGAIDVPHDVAPDLDKLIRAALDPLTGVVYADDRSVVSVKAKKLYANPNREPGLFVTVRLFEDPVRGLPI